MKNIMKNSSIINAAVSALFVTVLSFGAIGFTPIAHAQYDDFGSDIGDGCCGDSYVSGGYTSYDASASSYVSDAYSTYDSSYPSYVSDAYSTYDSSTPSYISDAYSTYDASTPSYVSDAYSTYAPSYSTGGYGSTGGYTTGGYSTGGYTTGGYRSGGYSIGGYSTGGGYTVGGGYPIINHTVTPTPVVTPVAPVTNNTCTNNSCNHDDHSVVNIQNPAPVINNNNVIANYGQTQTQVCGSGYYGTYPNCYINRPVVYPAPIAQPVVYGSAPYVSLSQVPYTGLELGFWGTIAYWGFMVAFALFAAYLIAVKRVQNSIASYIKSVLYGSDEVVEVTTPVEVEVVEVTTAPAQTNGDAIDSFIMSQINRTRRA